MLKLVCQPNAFYNKCHFFSVVKDDELYNTGPSITYWIITAGVFAGTLLLGLVAYLLRRGRKLNYHGKDQITFSINR